MPCWLRLRVNRTRSWDRRSIASSMLVCCSGRVCRRMRRICSNMPLFRTRPMARYFASRDARFMLASPKLSRTSSRKSRKASRRCWPVTAPRPSASSRQSTTGSVPAGTRCSTRPISRPSVICGGAWSCSFVYQKQRHAFVARLPYKTRSAFASCQRGALAAQRWRPLSTAPLKSAGASTTIGDCSSRYVAMGNTT